MLRLRLRNTACRTRRFSAASPASGCVSRPASLSAEACSARPAAWFLARLRTAAEARGWLCRGIGGWGERRNGENAPAGVSDVPEKFWGDTCNLRQRGSLPPAIRPKRLTAAGPSHSHRRQPAHAPCPAPQPSTRSKVGHGKPINSPSRCDRAKHPLTQIGS